MRGSYTRKAVLTEAARTLAVPPLRLRFHRPWIQLRATVSNKNGYTPLYSLFVDGKKASKRWRNKETFKIGRIKGIVSEFDQ